MTIGILGVDVLGLVVMQPLKTETGLAVLLVASEIPSKSKNAHKQRKTVNCPHYTLKNYDAKKNI